jgi:hypothetical protein
MFDAPFEKLKKKNRRYNKAIKYFLKLHSFFFTFIYKQTLF